MKSTIKAVMVSMLLCGSVSFTSCNNAEPDIDDRYGIIEQTVEVGGSFAFLDGGYSCDNGFVGDVTDNGKEFNGLHVGSCIVKNSSRDYRFVVTSKNNVINPVMEWGMSQKDLVEKLGETSCVVDGDEIVYTTGQKSPVMKYTYVFESDKLAYVHLNYIPDDENTVSDLDNYLNDRFLITRAGADEAETLKGYNALAEDVATTLVMGLQEKVPNANKVEVMSWLLYFYSPDAVMPFN